MRQAVEVFGPDVVEPVTGRAWEGVGRGQAAGVQVPDDPGPPPVIFGDDPPAEPQDQLARAVLETGTLAVAYDRLAPQLPPTLRWRAAGMSSSLSAALKRHFGGIND